MIPELDNGLRERKTEMKPFGLATIVLNGVRDQELLGVSAKTSFSTDVLPSVAL